MASDAWSAFALSGGFPHLSAHMQPQSHSTHSRHNWYHYIYNIDMFTPCQHTPLQHVDIRWCFKSLWSMWLLKLFDPTNHQLSELKPSSYIPSCLSLFPTAASSRPVPSSWPSRIRSTPSRSSRRWGQSIRPCRSPCPSSRTCRRGSSHPCKRHVSTHCINISIIIYS